MEISFSRELHTIEEAFEELELIFSDKQIHLINLTDKELTFQIRLPSDPGWYVDPEIAKLTDKELKNLPLGYSLIGMNNRFFLQTYFHYNALIAIYNYENVSGDKIDCLIHFDDHSDMMPIYKLVNKNLSYKERIQYGELTIGNFITNYLVGNNIDIYHIQNHKSSNFTRESFNYYIKNEAHNVGNMSFSKFDIQKTNEHSKSYKRMNLSDFKKVNIKYKHIWLDIDLDYFCNRFNRDSDWKDNGYLDCDIKELKQQIDKFVIYIKNLEWVKNIKVITIASSPGFFPFQYLEYIEKKLAKELKRVIGIGNI